MAEPTSGPTYGVTTRYYYYLLLPLLMLIRSFAVDQEVRATMWLLCAVRGSRSPCRVPWLCRTAIDLVLKLLFAASRGRLGGFCISSDSFITVLFMDSTISLTYYVVWKAQV